MPVKLGAQFNHGAWTAEITGIAAADIIHDFLSMMLSDSPPGGPKLKPKATRDEL